MNGAGPSGTCCAGGCCPAIPCGAGSSSSASRSDCARIADGTCPPDIVGINHYLTSDRFLDHRTERYPASSRGSVRSGRLPISRRSARWRRARRRRGALREAWERYRLPLALTEIHLGCTREEQLRWLAGAWDAATALRAEGLEIVAVTAWSLLGAYDWSSLLTRREGTYESGAYDVSAGVRRPTALARLIRDLASGHAPRERLIAPPGWWQREARLVYPPHRIAPSEATRAPPRRDDDGAPLLILGATGTLGQAFAGACRLRDIPYVLTTRRNCRSTILP
jgi:dTDP-4-dehydrorhamnose reductase